MRIDFVNDLGAPLAVTAVDLVTETVKPEWNEWAAYACAALGYGGSYMGYGGQFVKNFGIASFPWAAKKVYERIKGATSSGTSRGVRRLSKIARYPAPAYTDEFADVRLD